jgi:ABC-type transport system substrate-binding protein
LVFKFAKDANTIKMQLLMQETDVGLIPADTNLVDELSQTRGVVQKTVPGPAMEQLVLQTRRPPLNDVLVRRALAAAIDRQMIARVILKGQVETAQAAIVPTAPMYAFDDYKINDKNPQRVTELLTKAGYRKHNGWWERGGKRLTMTYVAGAGSVPFRARLAQLLQQQLKHNGIELKIQLVAPQILYTQGAPKGLFDIGEWSEPTGVDPLPSLLFACDQIPQKPRWAGKNRARYCRDETDELLKTADRTIDLDKRVDLLHQVNHKLAEDVPILPLFDLPETIAYVDDVEGVQHNPVGGPLWTIEDWRKKGWSK